MGEVRQCEKDFSNLLSCYDPKFRVLMQDLQQLENVDYLRDVCNQLGFGEQSKDDQLDAVAKAARQSFEKIFITLLDRGSLHRLLVAENRPTKQRRKLSGCVRMFTNMNLSSASSQQQAAAIAAEPEPVVEDPHDVCVWEFHNLGSAAFKANICRTTTIDTSTKPVFHKTYLIMATRKSRNKRERRKRQMLPKEKFVKRTSLEVRGILGQVANALKIAEEQSAGDDNHPSAAYSDWSASTSAYREESVKCASCGQDLSVEVCGHVAHDPAADPRGATRDSSPIICSGKTATASR